MAGKLVMVRHGQSIWNLENLFTGWIDIDLTPAGCEEARSAARELSRAGFVPQMVHTSVLKRAIRTLWLMLDELDLMWLPVQRTWRLNERHYGALQGLNKTQTVERYGPEQVQIWRRSYEVPPPPLPPDDPRHPRLDPRYADVDPRELPATESLKDTLARVQPYWRERIAPQLAAGVNVLVVAHGNSLRALIKMLDGLSDREIVERNVPTGIPLLYEFDVGLQRLSSRYLGAPDAVQAATEAVLRQTQAGPAQTRDGSVVQPS